MAMKVLSTFHGSRGRLGLPLRSVLDWFAGIKQPDTKAILEQIGDIESADDVITSPNRLVSQHPHTATKAKRMLWSRHASGSSPLS